ncbi:MAG: Gldg family protein [Deltaproteobacteria bacterium]|nr:Gldg family protein [Candidatus Tharpella sp.]
MKRDNCVAEGGLFGRYGKLVLYIIVVVMINLVGINLFTRVDLTANKLYSLSPASKEVVATLSEPLTIKIFFSGNLPAPYNGVERYVHDLLQEYELAGNRYFNYQFFDPSGDDETVAKVQKMALSYGIQPVQIRAIEKDEVKFQNAYMGLVLIHGDLVEILPAIIETKGLEYHLTTTIKRMNNKISRLLALPEKVKINLFLSSSLETIAPYMNLDKINQLPDAVSSLVKRLNDQLYNQIEFTFYNPTQDVEAEKKAAVEKIMELQWKPFNNQHGVTIPGDHGYAGITVTFASEQQDIDLISVANVPIFGQQYQLTPMADLELTLNTVVEDVIGINEQIGYLSGHGTLPLMVARPMPGQPPADSASHFYGLLSQEYAPKMVTLDKMSSLAGIKTLIIVRPTEKFTDYELYLLDQFIMRGNNLALFYDPFKEQMPQQNMMMMGMGPTYVPIATGLEKLISHYGVNIGPAYVMDQECFKQPIPQQQGGGERLLYFAPLLKSEKINKDFPFIKNIKGLVMVKAAPLTLVEKEPGAGDIQAARLFSSSDNSWLMKNHIDLNPELMHPPAEEKQLSSQVLAYLLEGSFSSYFKGQPQPDKPVEKKGETEADSVKSEDINADSTESAKVLAALAEKGELSSSGDRLDQGKPGRLIVVGSADILRNNIVDEAGQTPNAQLLLNMVDYLNGRQELAVLRTKTQSFNPLADIDPESRSLIKGANLIGLPLLVIFAGFIAWLYRSARRRRLKRMFS